MLRLSREVSGAGEPSHNHRLAMQQGQDRFQWHSPQPRTLHTELGRGS